MNTEYPKALYMGGEPAGESAVVQDAEQEAAKREAGFRMIGEAAPSDESAETVETLRAELDAAGIEYDKRWGVAKLKAALPQE